jgi:hypothetical protein
MLDLEAVIRTRGALDALASGVARPSCCCLFQLVLSALACHHQYPHQGPEATFMSTVRDEVKLWRAWRAVVAALAGWFSPCSWEAAPGCCAQPWQQVFKHKAGRAAVCVRSLDAVRSAAQSYGCCVWRCEGKCIIYTGCAHPET